MTYIQISISRTTPSCSVATSIARFTTAAAAPKPRPCGAAAAYGRSLGQYRRGAQLIASCLMLCLLRFTGEN